MFKELDDGDWAEVFKYAQPKICEAGHIHGPESTIFSTTDTSEFTRDGVLEIIGLDCGVNDDSNWIGAFLLKDGRYAFITAWCDYTGWG